MKKKISLLVVVLLFVPGFSAAAEKNLLPAVTLIQNRHEIRQWREWMDRVTAYLKDAQKTIRAIRTEFLDIHIQVKESRGDIPPDLLRKIKRFEDRLDSQVQDFKERRPPSELLKYHLFIIEYFRLLRHSQGDLLEKNFISYSKSIKQADTIFLRGADELLKILQKEGAPPAVLNEYQEERRP